MSKGARGERAAVHVAVILLAVAVLAPFLWLLQMSVKTQEEIFAFPPKLVFAPTFENYRALWDSTFRRSFTNSAAVSVTSTVLAMLLGVPGAYALSRARFRAAGQLSLWVLASRMAPPIAFTIPYFLAYRHLGLLDTRTGLVVIYLTFNLSLVVWLMRSFFDATRGCRCLSHQRRSCPCRRRVWPPPPSSASSTRGTISSSRSS